MPRDASLSDGCTSHHCCSNSSLHTQRNLFQIFLNEIKIRLYLLFSDRFGTKRTSVWFQINLKMVNTISFWFDLKKILRVFSVYIILIGQVVGSRKGNRLCGQISFVGKSISAQSQKQRNYGTG